ncbi:M23 family metallopeptidase, partial [Acinetobacter baumannii]|nr:M23 family metallopeptidase [Acinetobacter baumannii]
MAGTFEVKTGDIVEAGDKLAKVGSSGNSSGPHCHICVYDLGGADQFQHIASTWNGDMAMNTGWNQ